MRTLPALVERAAATFGNKPAIVGSRTYTYGELVNEARRVARSLSAHGVNTGDLVGVAAARSASAPALALGAMMVGAVYVPLDPLYPDPALADILAAARPAVVVLDPESGGRLPAGKESVLHAGHVRSPHSREQPLPIVDGAGPAYAMFTSGSTGAPKGMLLGHTGLAQYAWALRRRIGLRPGDRCLGVAPLGFSSSVRQLLVPLGLGATVVVPDDEQVRDPLGLTDLVRQHGVTQLDVTPSYWRALLDSVPHSDLVAAVTSVRRYLFASERLGADLVVRTRGAHRSYVRQPHVWNMYGCTETTGIVAAHLLPPDEPVKDPIPIGRGLGHVRLIVQPDDCGSRSHPARGRLVVEGQAVALDSFGGTEPNGTCIAEDMVLAGRRIDTGDVVQVCDGVLVWIGRADRVSKVRGMRVHHDAVEAQLCADPMVRRAAVVATTERGIRAVVQIVDGPQIGSTELLERLRRRVPAHLVPASVAVAAAWPTLPNGKTDYQALRAQHHTAAEADESARGKEINRV